VAKKSRKKSNKKRKKSAAKRTGRLQNFIFFLNCFLCALLAILVIYEFLRVSSPKEEVTKKTDSVVVSTYQQTTTEYQDMAFLIAALGLDEMDTARAKNWEEKIVHINKTDTPPEDVYGLYEEKLPEDKIEKPVLKAKPADFKKPVIAIVIDDMGISHKRTADISSLKHPLTASFLTYATDLDKQIAASKASGHEIMAHIPMEPKAKNNISPDVLTVSMDDGQIRDRLSSMLAKFKNIKGVNNHMGSLFTEDSHRMGVVMQELSKRGLFFLDSKTTPNSAAVKSAEKYKVTHIERNVFLDNANEFDYIMQQLNHVESIARKNGYAIAIGHPKSQTYLALKAWLPTLKSKGIKLVHLSDIVKVLKDK